MASLLIALMAVLAPGSLSLRKSWKKDSARAMWPPPHRGSPSNCGLQSPVANSLAEAIKQGEVKYGIHIAVPGHSDRSSMDCMMIMENTETSLLAVFHTGAGGEEGYNALHLAVANVSSPGQVPGTGDWKHHSVLSRRGSMGYYRQVQDSDVIFLAYELENHHGNRIALRQYNNRADLLRGYWVREVQMARYVVGASDTGESPKNMGTPSIASIKQTAGGVYEIGMYYHYYHTSDIPGWGTVRFPTAGGGVVSENYQWADSYFARDVNNAMRMADGVGKIGQRTEIIPPGNEGALLLLYETQLAEAGELPYGWLSWRLFLYQAGCTGTPAAHLDLEMPSHLQTFANPHANVVGDWMYLGFFIPSEPFNGQVAAEYANCEQVRYRNEHGRMVNVTCPTCKDNPMQGAGSPASPGSMLLSVKVSDVFN